MLAENTWLDLLIFTIVTLIRNMRVNSYSKSIMKLPELRVLVTLMLIDVEEVHGNWETFVDAEHTFFILQDQV